MKVDSSLLPLPLHCSFMHVLHRRNLFEGKAAEKFEIHDFGECRFRSRQIVEGVTDLAEIRDLGSPSHLFIEGCKRKFAAALDRMPAPRIVDNQPPHHSRRIAHESGQLREIGTVFRRHFDVGLVDQRRCAQADWQASPS